MRALFALLALLGLAGIVFGVLTIVSHTRDGMPFGYENYGGPGSVIGGVLLVAVSLYLFFNWGRFGSSAGTSHDV